MTLRLPSGRLSVRSSGLQLYSIITPSVDHCLSCSQPSTQRVCRRSITSLRRGMWNWMNTVGEELKQPRKSSTNYLTQYDRNGAFLEDKRSDNAAPADDAVEDLAASPGEAPETKQRMRPPRAINPFPLNEHFKSETVLSEALRDEIYRQVVEQSKSVREVSANLGVDMRRVGAVVRLKTIENDWIKEGKRRALPYQKAVLGMLPQTPFVRGLPVQSHESINDLPVHSSTGHQLFHPTSESRHFTRIDAGKVFHPHLLPADQRIPHAELIQLEKDRLAGMPDKERARRHSDRLKREKREREVQQQQAREAEEKRATIVKGQRWDFVFRDINAENVGVTGRAPGAVGWRYGVPLEDRKRGQVKIPTGVQ